MSGIFQTLLGSLAGVVKDTFFRYVTLLLPGNGTNGAQNNTFTDASTNNFTITRNGNTTQGTFSPYGSNWSNYFDGNGDYLSIGSNAVLAPGTGDFWIEAWVSFGALPASNAIANVFQNDVLTASSNDKFWFGLFNNAGTNQLAVGRHNTSTRASVNWTPTISVWYHVAAARASGTTYLFIDGVSQSVTGSANFNGVSFGQAGAVIGAVSTPQYLTGYLSNVRYIVGAALYTATFTVPTAPLTTTSQGASSSQVEILSCQSNRLIDNSTNAFAITKNGDVSVQRFSPFSPTDAYSASVIGGSGYFDGTGDYLDVTNNNTFDTNTTFTLECWFYQTASGDDVLFNRGGGGTTGGNPWNTTDGYQFILAVISGAISWQINNGTALPTNINGGAPTVGAWNHVAVGYDGITTRIWLNGTSVGTTTQAYTLPTTRNIVRAGAAAYLASNVLNGYLSNLRFVKGTDVYGVGNSTITVPTSPLTAITNTSLLLNFTNAGIIDNAMMNDLETVGNAQISTAQSKFGGSSMLFDGTGDYLTASGNLVLNSLGAGPFTVEMWVYRLGNGTGGASSYDSIIGSNSGISSVWGIYVNRSTGVISFNNSAGLVSTSNTLSNSTWTHIAVCRDGSNNLQIFINGTSGYSATNTGTGTLVNPLRIGDDGTGGGGNHLFNGYIDDLRITKGVARYTTTFTPPAAAFPTS